MKIAAAHALAALAREDVPDEVAAAYGARPKYGPDYIIPVPFDPRLISSIPPAVAQAAMDSKVARRPIVDMGANRQQLRMRLDPVAGVLQRVFERLRRQPRRVVFAEGEEEQVIRAAASFVQQGLGTALLVGREARVRDTAKATGVELGGGIEIVNAALSSRNAAYAAHLYERLQRHGYLQRDCQRLVNTDRNHFAASSAMSAMSEASGISVTAVSATRTVRPRASTSDTPMTRWPGFGSMQRCTSSSATEKLRVTPVTIASASPSATMQAAKWLRSVFTSRWQSRCR